MKKLASTQAMLNALQSLAFIEKGEIILNSKEFFAFFEAISEPEKTLFRSRQIEIQEETYYIINRS